jgi:transcriptional repressor NrdR
VVPRCSRSAPPKICASRLQEVPTCATRWDFLRYPPIVTYNTLTHKICRGRDLPLTCPTCRKSETRVVDSRDDETVVRRRRECLDPRCKHRFTTYERMEVPRLFVVKKDGRREQYSREKILAGLRKACEKRPISESRMEAVAADLERELFARGESEVQSALVGEKLMEALRALDPVAYIRFASVYRSFRDIESFREELAQL